MSETMSEVGLPLHACPFEVLKRELLDCLGYDPNEEAKICGLMRKILYEGYDKFEIQLTQDELDELNEAERLHAGDTKYHRRRDR